MEAIHESSRQPDGLDALWSQFEECQPLLTTEELEEVSRMLFATEGIRTVRAGLTMLTVSGRKLLEVMHGDTEMVGVYEELAECLKDRAARLRSVADSLDTAQARLRLALCDVQEAAHC
jgi:hypothetical protein